MIKQYLIAIIALLPIFFVMGCSSDTNNSYTTYVNQSDYVELQYPVNWTVHEYYLNKTIFYPPINNSSNDYDFYVSLSYHSTQGDSISGRNPFTLEDSRALMTDRIIPPYESNVKILNVKNISLSGLPGFEYTYTDTSKKGMLIIGYAGYYQYGGEYVLKAYAIEYVANEYAFDVHIDEFKHMISTFKIIT